MLTFPLRIHPLSFRAPLVIPKHTPVIPSGARNLPPSRSVRGLRGMLISPAFGRFESHRRVFRHIGLR